MTTLYKKVGRRYVPVGEYSMEAINRLPYGSHLITVHRTGGIFKYNVDPAYAPLVAASRTYTSAIVDSLREEYDSVRPSTSPKTKKQKLAWEKLKNAFDEFNHAMDQSSTTALLKSSLYDIAESGTKALELEAQRMLQNPAVKNAYEQFLLIYKLTKDNENAK